MAKTAASSGGQPTVPRSLNKAGQRTALQCIAPAGRSSLKVLRNYQQELKTNAGAFDTVFDVPVNKIAATPAAFVKTTLSVFCCPPHTGKKSATTAPRRAVAA